jgi:putative oxidoreductase
METPTIASTSAPVDETASAQDMRATTSRIRSRALAVLARFDWLALLSGRLAAGLLFASTGWGKVRNLAKVSAFFESLHIPAPWFNATLVGYSELLCGTALVIGLASRLATIPLCVSMLVALATAKASEIHGVIDLIGQEELAYVVMLFLIAVLGPGRASLDALLFPGVHPHSHAHPNTARFSRS